jgi:hypothetical protein
MFGDYVVYCRNKPVFLVCDNTVFVKNLPEVAEIFEKRGEIFEKGYPFDGSNERIILDVDDADLATEIVKILAKILPYPKSFKAKRLPK